MTSRPRSVPPCASFKTTRKKSPPSTKSHRSDMPLECLVIYVLINRRSLPTCKRHDEACRCCRCTGSPGAIKIRIGRYGSSNEILHAGDGNRFSWRYPDVGNGVCRQFRLRNSTTIQIGRGGGESRPWPGSSRSCFANGNHYGALG